MKNIVFKDCVTPSKAILRKIKGNVRYIHHHVEPDISVICDKDKLNDRGCVGTPDFVIEVVSKSSRKMDYTTKNALYSDAGVREYWIVDPEKERTTIYYYEQDEAPMISLFTQTIQSGIYEGLEINISELLK